MSPCIPVSVPAKITRLLPKEDGLKLVEKTRKMSTAGETDYLDLKCCHTYTSKTAIATFDFASLLNNILKLFTEFENEIANEIPEQNFVLMCSVI